MLNEVSCILEKCSHWYSEQRSRRGGLEFLASFHFFTHPIHPRTKTKEICSCPPATSFSSLSFFTKKRRRWWWAKSVTTFLLGYLTAPPLIQIQVMKAIHFYFSFSTINSFSSRRGKDSCNKIPQRIDSWMVNRPSQCIDNLKLLNKFSISTCWLFKSNRELSQFKMRILATFSFTEKSFHAGI